jgi:sugar/nucleoside kinase (ribokinase family)
VTRILCVGLATVDLIYSVAAIPGVDEKAQATDLAIAAGGPAANAAVTAATLGAEVILVTAIGAHPLGDLVRADLAAHGVHVVDADPANPAPPPVSAVTVLEPTGERTIVSRNAGDLAARVPEGGLPDADLTLVDGHHPALALAAARSARRLLVDAGSWRPIFTEIFPYAEVVACSAAFRHPAARSPRSSLRGPVSEGHAASAGTEIGSAPNAGTEIGSANEAEPLTSKMPRHDITAGPAGDGPPAPTARDAVIAAVIAAPHVVVTHGPGPVSWFSGSRSGTVAVPAVAAVDTAGAGDAFHGALAVALAVGDELPVAVAVAVRVAGVRVVSRGPRAWLATLTAYPGSSLTTQCDHH